MRRTRRGTVALATGLAVAAVAVSGASAAARVSSGVSARASTIVEAPPVAPSDPAGGSASDAPDTTGPDQPASAPDPEPGDGNGGSIPPVPPPPLGLAPGEPPSVPPNIGGWPTIGPVTAASYLAVDVESGTVLAARDADRLRSVASTVKMLTALTARRLEPDLDRVLTAGPEVAGLEGSGVGIVEGESWTVRDLLAGMLVRSGNDAAEVVASQLLPGGRPAFLAEMVVDAARLGLDGVVIVSPSGLDDRNQLSAAHLAAIAVEVLRDPVLAELVDAEAVRLPDLGVVPTRNELLLRDEDVIGVKTGFTEAAGASVVAAAEDEDRITIAVVLDAADLETRFEEAEQLLDHAEEFTSLPALTPVALGCPGSDVTLRPAATAVVVPTGTQDQVEVPWPPRQCPDRDELVVTPTLQRLPLAPVTVAAESAEIAPADDADARLGRWLARAVQDAMRAVPPAAVLDEGPPDGV